MLIPRINPCLLPQKTFSPSAITPRHNQKGKNMIIADIPKDVTFDLPEGRYRARISKLKSFDKQTARGLQPWIRILFEVTVPGLSEKIETLAGRSFKMNFNTGSELRNFLSGLLGRQFFQKNAGEKVSLDSLLGTECEVGLVHAHDDRYDRPLVVVANLYPISLASPVLKMEVSNN